MKTMAIEFTLTRVGLERSHLEEGHTIRLGGNLDTLRCRVVVMPSGGSHVFWQERNLLGEIEWVGGPRDVAQIPLVCDGRRDAVIGLALRAFAFRMIHNGGKTEIREMANGAMAFDLGII